MSHADMKPDAQAIQSIIKSAIVRAVGAGMNEKLRGQNLREEEEANASQATAKIMALFR